MVHAETVGAFDNDDVAAVVTALEDLDRFSCPVFVGADVLPTWLVAHWTSRDLFGARPRVHVQRDGVARRLVPGGGMG